ncbi:MAG: hypothetical protein ACI4AD_02340 [Roseburia sp.]
MWDKIRKVFFSLCEILEFLMALAAIAGIVVAVAALFPQFVQYWNHRLEAEAFLEFLDGVFTIVIGIEFVKMLCKPSSENIIEVLIFLISRHMIIQTTTAVEDLLSVISICILFLFRRFMAVTKPEKRSSHESGEGNGQA